MINQRLTRAVEKLAVDDRLLVRFRRKPEKSLVKFRLSTEEIEAVRTGDLRALLDLGLDQKVAFPKPLRRPLFASILIQFGAKLAPAAFVVMALAISPGSIALADGGVRVARRARMSPRAARFRWRARGRQLRNLRRVRGRLARHGIRGRARSRLSLRRRSVIVRRRALRSIFDQPEP